MRLLSILAVLTGAIAGAACSPAPGVTIQSVGGSPAGTVSPALISVPVGIVLAFQVKSDGSTPVTASIDDPTIAALAPTTETSKFVVIGLSQGQTTLHVFGDNAQATQLTVQVAGQVLQLGPSDASLASGSATPTPSASR